MPVVTGVEGGMATDTEADKALHASLHGRGGNSERG